MDPSAVLQQGREILDPLLTAHGFHFELGDSDVGSGGRFARGAYVRGDRRLSFSMRFALGHVQYSIGAQTLPHEEFMRVVAQDSEPQYPGFSSDPLDGFRHLHADLLHFGRVFLEGSDREFAAVATRAAETTPPSGFKRLSTSEGSRRADS